MLIQFVDADTILLMLIQFGSSCQHAKSEENHCCKANLQGCVTCRKMQLRTQSRPVYHLESLTLKEKIEKRLRLLV